MAEHSAIEWTDATWNPSTGCTKVSPACANCYIERTPPFRIAGRKFVNGHIPLEFHATRLTQPLSWRKPARVFVNSMSDLFHEDVSDAFIDKVFAVMALAERHTFQILTKRPERMRDYLLTLTGSVERMDDLEYAAVEIGDSTCAAGALEDRGWPLPNVWLGCSVENQHFADERIPLLLQTPAAVRFISAEPLLGPVNLASIRWEPEPGGMGGTAFVDVCKGTFCTLGGYGLPGPKLDWVIVGGESGPGARPFDLAWARSIVSQCKAAGVPVFMKQVGSNWREASPNGDPGLIQWVTKDRKGGDIAEWPADMRVREFPEVSR